MASRSIQKSYESLRNPRQLEVSWTDAEEKDKQVDDGQEIIVHGRCRPETKPNSARIYTCAHHLPLGSDYLYVGVRYDLAPANYNRTSNALTFEQPITFHRLDYPKPTGEIFQSFSIDLLVHCEKAVTEFDPGADLGRTNIPNAGGAAVHDTLHPGFDYPS
jgi:hypothetical protein